MQDQGDPFTGLRTPIRRIRGTRIQLEPKISYLEPMSDPEG